jgi:sucrose phosphorylase
MNNQAQLIAYVDRLPGSTFQDLDLLRRTRVGRDINRRYYTAAGLQQDLARPVVRSLLALARLRNTHPAFAATFAALATPPDRLALTWTHGRDVARLDVDLTAMTASVTGSDTGGNVTAWCTSLEAQA